MQNEEFDSETIGKVLVLELLKFSISSLLYMTKDIQRILIFTDELLKLTAWQPHGMFLMFVIKKKH